jgi:hypothetical protein
MTQASYRFFNDPAARSPSGDTFAFWSDPVLAMAWAREALRRLDAVTFTGDSTVVDVATWWASWAGDAWANAWLALNVPPIGVPGLSPEHKRRQVLKFEAIEVLLAEPWAEPTISASAYAMVPGDDSIAEYQERRMGAWVREHGNPTTAPMNVQTGLPGIAGDTHNNIVLVDIPEENLRIVRYPERWKTLGTLDWLRLIVRPAIANFIANPWRTLVTAREDLDAANEARARAFGVDSPNETRAFASLARLRSAEMSARIAQSYGQGADAIAAALALGGPIGITIGSFVKLGASLISIMPHVMGVEVWQLPLADVIAGGHTLDESPQVMGDAPAIGEPPGYQFTRSMPPGWPAPLDAMGVEDQFVFGDHAGPRDPVVAVNIPYVPPQPVVDGYFFPEAPPVAAVVENVGVYDNNYVQPELMPAPPPPPVQDPAAPPADAFVQFYDDPLKQVWPEAQPPAPLGTVNNPIVIDAHPVGPTPVEGPNWLMAGMFGGASALVTVAAVVRSTWYLDELRRIERNPERPKREREDAAAAARLVENQRTLAGVGGTVLTAVGAWVGAKI